MKNLLKILCFSFLIYSQFIFASSSSSKKISAKPLNASSARVLHASLLLNEKRSCNAVAMYLRNQANQGYDIRLSHFHEDDVQLLEECFYESFFKKDTLACTIFVKMGININKNEDTLELLASEGRVEDLKRLLELGARPSFEDSASLRVSLMKRKTDISYLLLKYGANSDLLDSQLTLGPIGIAAKHSNFDMILELLEKNMTIYTEDFEAAANAGLPELCQELMRIKEGGSFNKDCFLSLIKMNQNESLIKFRRFLPPRIEYNENSVVLKKYALIQSLETVYSKNKSSDKSVNIQVLALIKAVENLRYANSEDDTDLLKRLVELDVFSKSIRSFTVESKQILPQHIILDLHDHGGFLCSEAYYSQVGLGLVVGASVGNYKKKCITAFGKPFVFSGKTFNYNFFLPAYDHTFKLAEPGPNFNWFYDKQTTPKIGFNLVTSGYLASAGIRKSKVKEGFIEPGRILASFKLL